MTSVSTTCLRTVYPSLLPAAPAVVSSVTCATWDATSCTAQGATVPMSGASVTIAGTFSTTTNAVSAVSIGGQACTSFSVDSAAQITCAAPARADLSADSAQAVKVVTASQDSNVDVQLTYSE